MTQAGNQPANDPFVSEVKPPRLLGSHSSRDGSVSRNDDSRRSDDQRDQLASSRRETDLANLRLQDTLEQISAAYFAFDLDWRLITINQRASDLWRTPLEDRIGERFWDVLPSWDESAFGKQVLETVESGTAGRFDHWHGRLQLWLDVHVYSSADGVTLYVDDATDRRRQEFHQRFLSDASAILTGSLDFDTTLHSLASLSVARLADFCVVDAIAEPGRIAQSAVAHADPGQRALLRTFRQKYPFDHDSAFGPGLAFRTGGSHLYRVIDDSTKAGLRLQPGRLDAFVELGFRSAIVAPMISRGIVQGVISLVSTSPGRFTEHDLALAEELAGRAGVAIDNARLYRNAQAAVTVREQFLSAAAHELRTPITSMRGYVGLLQREVSGKNDPERVLRYVHRLNDATGRLTALIEDMLDVSRMRSGQILLRPQSFDLAVLTRQVIARVAEQHVQNHNDIDYQGAESGAWLIADCDRIEQVLSNVIDNAIKYSPSGDALTVRLVPSAGGWEISVSDHGIGIPKGAHKSIFEPFGRAANAREVNVTGLGIGLSISKSIVERHGGAIWTESAGEGQGATVRFRLPTQPLD